MIAEILATGDEIRSGALIDSNSAYIAQKIEQTGVHVTRHICVGDDMQAIVTTLREFAERADIAVITGGLGPTVDDITTEAAAKAGSVGLFTDEAALESIEAFFLKRNRPMAPSNRKQALIPQGAECLYNPIGTAPGFRMQLGRCNCFFLPGVPREMRLLMKQYVLPAILALQGVNRVYRFTRTISTFGLPESTTGEKLAGFEEHFPEIQLGLRAKFPEIHIKFYLQGRDEPALLQRADRAAEWVCDRIGNNVLSVDGDPMTEVVGKLLSKRGDTVAVAESCTGGLISNWLTDVPGSSNYFLLSGVTYANQAKTDVLGVSPETLESYGAVHVKTAEEMAAGIRRLAGSSYGLSTSGIAGPGGGTDEKPVGTVCLGLASAKHVTSRRYNIDFGERSRNKRYFAMLALDLLRRELLV